MYKSFYIFHLLLFVIPFLSEAQNLYVDSLQNKLKQQGTSVSEKFKIYNQLTEWYRVEELYDKSDEQIKRHLQLANVQENDLEKTKALVNQGIVNNNKEEYSKSVISLEAAKTAAKTSNDKLAIAYALYLEAYSMFSYNDYETAAKLFQKLEQILEPTTEHFLKAKIYYCLYGIYSNYNDVKNTILYTNKLVTEAKASGDKNLLSNAYTASAVAYTLLYDTDKKEENLDKIFEESKKAITLYNDFKGQLGSRTYAIAKLNLASYYLNYYPKNITLIKEKTMEAVAAAQSAVGNQRVLANCYGLLSYLAQEQNDLATAENYLIKAYNILLSESPVYFYSMIQICNDLANLYHKIGNFEKAYQFQKLATDYNSELYNQEQASTSKKLEAQYQFEKKEQELVVLKERSESQRLQKILYAGLGIITLIGCFFMFRSYHFKLRYSLQKEKKLEAEKHESDLQIKLEKEEQYRLKAEQELLALKQLQLQNEVMASQLQLQHKNQVLNQLKEKLEGDASVNINQIIKEESLLDNNFEKTKFEIQEIHPNFFKTLNETTQHKLTSLDLKYCAYFYLGMETKQIANLLSVEAKSVRMTKYRLKQKFGLEAESDFIQYIKNIV